MIKMKIFYLDIKSFHLLHKSIIFQKYWGKIPQFISALCHLKKIKYIVNQRLLYMVELKFRGEIINNLPV